MSRLRSAAARGALAAFCALSSLYALFCFLPFSWINFVRDRRYPMWVGWFLRGHLALSLAVLLAGAAALRGRARNAWAAAAAVLALAAAASGGLSGRGPGNASLAWAFAAWIPYFAWEFSDAQGGGSGTPALAPCRPRALPTTAAALFCAAAYAAAARPSPSWSGAAAVAVSALFHWQLFLIAALALDLLGSEELVLRAALWLTAARGVVWIFSTLSFTGPAAWAYSGVLGAAILLFLFRTLLPLRASAREAARTAAGRAAAAAALAAWPWAARAAIAGTDWNRLFESLAAVACWVAAAAFFSATLPSERTEERERRALWTAAAAALALAWTSAAAARRWAAPLRLRRAGLEDAARRLADDDVSLAAARRILLPQADDAGFDAFLQENTNLPRSTGRGSRDLELVKTWGAAAVRPAHVFVIVIDSLRADYVGAYNPAVRFTPAIDAFARDAVVFRRAFSAYGGTGLSEPSIWAGARLPHMQYPSPFPPMNVLEKLIDRDGFRPLITLDVILTELLKPDKAAGALDRQTYGNYKLCGTLSELEGRLDRELASGKPLFVYTQPQDIHISVIQREGSKAVPAAAPVDGFYAPYASRLAGADACFGAFVADLKRRGIYDDSVIVLTADHGDSLGEGGRWGHAYTLFPEILRVPLIIRAPKRLLEGRYWNPDAAAYLTDVAPTLYALLGHEPDVEGEPFGRPLFEADRPLFEKRTRPARVVASSYGPVYGLLSGAGASLAVFDGVNRTASVFDLDKDPQGRSPRSDASAEASARTEIRASVEALRSFYGY